MPCLTGSLQQVLVQLEVFLQHLIDLPGVHLGVQLGRCLGRGTPGIGLSLLDESLLEVVGELISKEFLVVLQPFNLLVFFPLDGFDVSDFLFCLGHHAFDLREVFLFLFALQLPHFFIVEQGLISQELLSGSQVANPITLAPLPFLSFLGNFDLPPQLSA